MKKIISIFLILTILLIPIVSNAAIEVTEEKLENSIEKFQQKIDEEDDEIKLQIDKQNKKIVLIDKDGTIYDMDYKIGEKPEFSTEIKLNKNMSEEDITKEAAKLILPCFGFFMITDMNGTDMFDSLAYLAAKVIEGFKLEEIIDFDKVLEGEATDYMDYEKILELYASISKIDVKDDLFTLSLEEINNNKEAVLKINVVVNVDKDFSVIDGYMEKFIKDLEIKNKINTNVISNGIYQNNNIVTNINEIPKTGNEVSLVKVLTTIIIMSGIMMVSLSIYNRKRNS